MERICTQCHAVLAPDTDGDTKVDWCPACGGAITDQPVLSAATKTVLPPEVDHRGIVLPRRHAVGGIITPQ